MSTESDKHKVFISYHHDNDQWAKEELLEINKQHDVFIDKSVYTGDIPSDWPQEKIREEIRDHYLKDSTVTILLVGTETKYRKHVDWEIYSSMYDGKINKKSGILVVNLEGANVIATHGNEEKQIVYPDITHWTLLNKPEEYKHRYPNMPKRIIDNLCKGVEISVTNRNTILFPNKLRTLIDLTFRDRQSCNYDLSKPMMKYDQPIEHEHHISSY